MPFRFRRLFCASIVMAMATLSASVAHAGPLFYDYMDAQFGVAGNSSGGCLRRGYRAT